VFVNVHNNHCSSSVIPDVFFHSVVYEGQSNNLEFTPCSYSNVYQPRHFPSPSQDPLLPAGLPICLTASSLYLRFGFCWPLCAFINYIYLLNYILTYKVYRSLLGFTGTRPQNLTHFCVRRYCTLWVNKWCQSTVRKFARCWPFSTFFTADSAVNL